MHSKPEVSSDKNITDRSAFSSNIRLTDIDYAMKKAVEYHQSGQLQQAEEIYRKILEINPLNENAYYNMAVALNKQGRTEESIDCYLKVIELNPEDADAYYNIGAALSEQGKTNKAINYYKKAIEFNPSDMKAYNNMGLAFKSEGNTSEAIKCYRKAIEIDPNHLPAYNNLGIVLKDGGNILEAINYYKKAIEINSNDPDTYYNMGVAFYTQGEIKQATSFFRKALQINPCFLKAHSNLLFAMNYDVNCSQADYFSEAEVWGKNHGTAHESISSYNNLTDCNKRLKIGYFSPDFHHHPVSHFFLPLLAAHDSEQVETFCYCESTRIDDITRRIKGQANRWRSTVTMNDKEIIEQIQKDSIDIIVDLAGHTADNRLLIFTGKPAPVQVTWLGFPNTTGLKAIDYRLTDVITDPEGEADEYHTETLFRLSDGFLCYYPLENPPEVSTLPSLETGRITFCSFNNLSKINENVIELWSTILHQVPESRLILKSEHFMDDFIRNRYREIFSTNRIPSNRVEMLPFIKSAKDHMAQYNKTDIALDPFPYNGTTTTCEALWMGTPVITLCGNRHSARVGASILSRIKLEELIAKTEEEYVSKAVELALNREKMIGLRGELRKRMKESPLCNADTFARSVESAYRKMWIKWCEQTPATYTKPSVPRSTNLGSKKNHPDISCRVPIELESQNHVEESFSCNQITANLNSNDSDTYFNLGIKLTEQGKVEEAVVCYRKAVDINPHDADAYYNLGLSLNSLSKYNEAVYCYQKAIALNPDDIHAYNNMGLAYNSLGNSEKAIICYRKALEINPKHVPSYNNLGNALREQGNINDAIDCYQKVLEINSDDPQAYNNMGVAYKELGNFDESFLCYSKALEIYPAFFQAYNNMGTVLQLQGEMDEAISCYSKAIEIKPDYADAYYNMGNIYKDQERTDNAISSYIKSIEINPYHSSAYFNMANTLNDQGKTEDAISNYFKAIEIEPGMAEGYGAIGSLLNDQGKTEEALSYYQKALRIKPEPGLEVKSALLLPVVPNSMKEIIKFRERITTNLNLLSNGGISLEDPLKQVGILAFLLAYHGLNDKGLQEEIASFYIKACPELTWTSPNLSKRHRVQGKIKIGMVSTFLHGHTIGQLFLGLIRNLSRQKFYVTVFRFPGKEDAISKAIDSAADEVIILPYELVSARRKIADHLLDILFFLDIGMDPMTYFLAFSRLAPVQCKRGHPVTSGIPNIDYFLSPGTAETPEAEGHYSEQLVRLKTYGYYYYRPELQGHVASKEKFGLPEDSNLYICPQTLFKFHPDYDHVFGKILERDNTGLLILLEGRHRHWKEMLLERFTHSFPGAIDRVRFLPRMSYSDFLSLCMIADAVLDTPIFSGGKTSLDCFAFGIPIVTLPGEFMRGRLTLAQYKLMDVMDCVAKNEQDFVNISLRLASDKMWKEGIKNKILANCHVLFNNTEALHELEAFFEQAVQRK